MQKNALIIGAGIAGIASAIRLANKGYQVKVFENNAYPGGKLSEFSLQGYRFDAGPSLFTMAHLVDELFTLSGRNPRDYFNYKSLDIVCKYFYEDGTILHAYHDKQRFAEEVAQHTQDSTETVLRFLADSKRKYELTADVFLHHSLHKLRNYFTYPTLRGILNFGKLQTFTTMNQANERVFRDPRMVQFFNRYATYNGSDPYQTPATMNIIPHLEFGIGAFFPIGGMYAITESLVNLAAALGVEFRFNTAVHRILVENKRAIGLEIQPVEGEKQEISANIIISNMDMVNTYRRLLPNQKAPENLLNQPKSSSALIFYWGIKKPFPALKLHNIFFSEDYKVEFEHLFQHKKLYKDPTVYINISSKEQRSDAPDGAENWFVMVNAPNNSGQDWDAMIDEARQNIFAKLSRLLNTNLGNYVAVESILDPRLIETRTSSHLGALYGNSSNNKWAAFLRHANFSSRIRNLYFCGGSVHPGGGIPLCLLSAKIVGDLIRDDVK
jgi:phytoene desaturase